MVGLRLNEAKSELEPVQDVQCLGLPLLLDKGRASLPVSKAREIWHTHAEHPPRKPCCTEKCPNLWDHSIGPQVSSHVVIYTCGPYNTFIH